MPTSFDKEMTINELDPHKCLVSTGGPLEITTDETVERLDIWIFQDDAACVGFLERGDADLNVAGKRWKIVPDPEEAHFGNGFKPGAAIGMGLLVKTNTKTGQVTADQWNRAINLVLGEGGGHEH